MGFPLLSEFANENHGEAGSSKQCNDQHTDQTAFFLAPIITDLIRSTRRELYDAEIGINGFLDQKIPKGGYVRILVESLLWEERLGKTRIRLQRASLHAWSCTEVGQLRAAVGIFTKAMVRPRTRADHGHSRGN